MDKREFLKKTLAGFGTIVSLPVLGGDAKISSNAGIPECDVSPKETRGPFPIKSPSDLMRANIVGDRQGIALLINLKIQSQSKSCQPLSGVDVDVWHCDAQGNYSQYGGNGLQQSDYRNTSFLRGRQRTNSKGEVSFISIFPGWYPGRAPHLHLDILQEGEIILSTQIAFPKKCTLEVYASRGYKGEEDTSNERDGIFRNSLEGNMADSVSGNLEDGYTLFKLIITG
ncbi:dioxygenase-like protein [Algoriphagus aquaeductus]|uniref:Dioxygenase-like protein n=1 Tax=Algoriphagus aquaeductus TaxID=475299 RepID=A0A326RW06_9BACT|nr:intradiol ring-cleavage dioxygenase [Algoriphagus aquaeductus]PZV85390.1 dioxygenase-like protein [Algoriphagus aquaeductus]